MLVSRVTVLIYHYLNTKFDLYIYLNGWPWKKNLPLKEWPEKWSKRCPKRKDLLKYQHISFSFSVDGGFLHWISTIIISIVTMLLIYIIIASHGLRGGLLRLTVGHSQGLVKELFTSFVSGPRWVCWLCCNNCYRLGFRLVVKYAQTWFGLLAGRHVW